MHGTQATLLAATVDLGAPSDRRSDRAEDALLQAVHSWQLPKQRAQRYLTGARRVLEGPDSLTMHVQYDRVTQIVSLELWSDESVLFSLDDWTGC